MAAMSSCHLGPRFRVLMMRTFVLVPVIHVKYSLWQLYLNQLTIFFTNVSYHIELFAFRFTVLCRDSDKTCEGLETELVSGRYGHV
jgi:hypothetical protein